MFYKPTPQKSFGPNGTHWPELLPTPFPFDNTIPNKIAVACSWDAIKSAIEKLTQAQVDEGVIIFIEDGTLRGNGASSGSAAVLKGIGNPNWGKRVTVCPKNGYGAVKVENGMKCEDVSNICFALFEIKPDFNFRGCRNSALAWSSYTDWMGCYGSTSYVTANCEFTEVIREKSTVKTGDCWDGYTAGGRIENWLLKGCYLAPNFRPAGSSSHADTLQFAATNGGSYGKMFFKNCAIFSANNCSIQTGNIDGMELDNCAIISSSKSLSRYPRLDGADQGGVNSAFNGSGKNFKIFNSYVFGNLALNTKDAPRVWLKVENTYGDRTYSGVNVPLEGEWLQTNEVFDLDKRCPIPTQSYLKAIWAGSGVVVPPIDPPVDPPPVDPPVDPPVVLPDGSYYASTSIKTVSAGAASEGLVEYKFSVKPHASNIDYVVGLCADTPNGYSDMAAIVQFFTDGGIHVRDGSSYSPILAPYVAGMTYNFTVNVNTETKKYSVIMDGNPLAVAFSFRTEQAGASKLPFLSFVSTENASATISGISSKLIGDVPPVDPPPVDPPTEKVKVIVITEVSTDLENWNKISESEIEVGKNTVFTRTTLKKA